jgi:hypothetical protein
MKVAWVSNFKPEEHLTHSHSANYLPGALGGGAEMTDNELQAKAPAGVEIIRLGVNEWEQALGADQIIITSSNLTDEEMIRLAAEEPVVLLHHLQARSSGRRYLLEKAKNVIVHTPAHADKEAAWTDRREFDLILSPIDPDECWSEPEKLERATWAARMHDLKGPLRARYWAACNGIPLDFLTNVDRSVVLEHLARNRYWVFLPLEWGSESRGTIEAILSDCQPVVNENVSLISYERWQDKGWLSEQVRQASHTFWTVALD